MNIPFIKGLLTGHRSRGLQAPGSTAITSSMPSHATRRHSRGPTAKNYIKDNNLRKAQLRAAQALYEYYMRRSKLLPWQVGGTLLGGATTTASILMLLHKLVDPDFISDRATLAVVKTVDKSSEQLGDRVNKVKEKYLKDELPQAFDKILQQAEKRVLDGLQRVPDTLPGRPSISRQQPPRLSTEYNSSANVRSSGNVLQRSVYNTGDYLLYFVPQNYRNIYLLVRGGNYLPLIPLGYSAVPWVLKLLSKAHK